MLPSLLDNDFYKFTMQCAVLQCYPEAEAEYEFFNRDPKSRFSADFLERLRQEVAAIEGLALSAEERQWLADLNRFSDEYLHWLADYRFSSDEVEIDLTEECALSLRVHGPWVRTILWEVPLMAKISELYFETIDNQWNHDITAYFEKSLNKGRRLSSEECRFSDFGTRRRRSLSIQEAALNAFIELPDHLSVDVRSSYAGTSNVYFSRKFGTPPVGTVAHEWTMAHAGLIGVAQANERALRKWSELYEGDVSIALTDTFTTDLFLSSFDADFARAYDGVRHDSGDPFAFVDKVVAFYLDYRIDPGQKTLVFSDGLTVERAIEIEKYVGRRCKTAYGIGTHFTNDFVDSPSLNMVIKMTRLNGKPVAKISDEPSKATGHPEALREAREVIRRFGFSV